MHKKRADMTPPPVALFTYNRPDKTERVLNALKSQRVDRLYIFCDGPRGESDRSHVLENIKLVESFPHENKIIRRSPKNRGLSDSLISGISEAFKSEVQLVVLEDDCLPLPGFLSFMAANLSYWKNTCDVFSISAYHFIRDRSLNAMPYDVFFSTRFLPWGWATWQDRWHKVEDRLKGRINPFGSFRSIPEPAGMDMPFHVYAVENKRVDSWAIPLALITLFDGYRHVMPMQPLVNNIGMDDTGTNTRADNRIVSVACPRYPKNLQMCPKAYENPRLAEAFADSLSVLMPAQWFQEKVRNAMTLSSKEEDATLQGST